MLQVDVSKSAGAVRAIHGINDGPLCINGGRPGTRGNHSPYFKEIEFPTVRLHDCPFFYRGAVDVPCIFPLFHLDPTDPRNYKFKRTDDYIKAIVDCGCGIVYRLGVSIEQAPDYQYDTDPPADVGKWVEICANIIRHYNYGWADGYEFGIRYWEIWNEPDNGPSQWNGSFEEFTAFYIEAATKLKEKFPDLMIGGPALNGGMLSNARTKLEAFLPDVRKAGAPLDFLSWHAYPLIPGEQTTAAREVRDTLDQYGFTATESHLNEWNLGPPGHKWGAGARSPQLENEYMTNNHNHVGASLVAACLTALQDAPVDMTNYYRAGLMTRGMFDHDSGRPHKPFYAFRAFKKVLTETPARCAVSGADPDNGLAVLAGKSEVGDVLNLLLTNFDADPARWKIELQNVSGTCRLAHNLVLDASRNLEDDPDDSVCLENNTLAVSMPAYSVRLVTIPLQGKHTGFIEESLS
ncbi:MAG: hypothetical protein K9N51_05825 [Candidatus Pacebacteria bacterium]|nr:hypothetical protein [Candidatus Paceibacterota bacterium]